MPRIRTWKNEDLAKAVKKSTSYRQALKKLKLKPTGGNYEQIKKYIKELDLDTKHFTGKIWNKGLKGFFYRPLIPLKDILIKNSSFQSYKLKKRLFGDRIKEEKCEECGWAKRTDDGYLPLELDHINGDHQDNRLENLRVLCPNCHSLKPTHRGRNKKVKK